MITAVMFNKLFNPRCVWYAQNESMYSLVIIGAGPSGIALAVEALAAGVSKEQILIIEKAESHSWTLRSLYADDKLVAANYKGLPTVCEGVLSVSDMDKEESLAFFEETLNKTDVPIHYKEEVSKIISLSDEEYRFEIQTNKGAYKSQIVAIAIGIFGGPNRPKEYKLPRKLRKKTHFDITSFKAEGERILVVGGGDSATEYVQYLHKDGNDVDIAYRGATFHRPNDFNKKRLIELEQEPNVHVFRNSNIESVTISEDKKAIVHFKEMEPRTYDRIVYALGGTTPENFLRIAGITHEERLPIIDKFGETEIKGMFLCGDLLFGKAGGSIIAAFNNAHRTIEVLCGKYLKCEGN